MSLEKGMFMSKLNAMLTHLKFLIQIVNVMFQQTSPLHVTASHNHGKNNSFFLKLQDQMFADKN